MRVLFIVHALYGGGAERVVARVASALSAQHEVHVAVSSVNAGDYPVDDRVHLHVLGPVEYPLPILERVPGMYGRIRRQQLRRLKQELEADVSVSFLTRSNFDNVETRVGERVVVSVRSTLARTIPSERAAAAKEIVKIRQAARAADCIVAVSRNVGLEQVDDFGADPKKVRVIYNPIDCDEIARAVSEPVEDAAFARFREEHDFIVATAGRLTWQKGQWHLIRAFAQTHAEHPGAGLLLLGQGECEGMLREVARANGVAEDVYFAGFQANPFAYLGSSDVFAMSSMFEGFSNAMVEAMACGLPMVSTDCNSGPRELLAPNTDSRSSARTLIRAEFGLLTPVCSGDSSLCDDPLQPEERKLAEGLSLLMDDSALRDSLRARGYARVRDFSVPRVTAQWAEALGVDWDVQG